MKKIIAATVALFMSVTPSLADTCFSLDAEAGFIAQQLGTENRNLVSYNEMLKASMSVGDMASAQMYIDMGMNTIIRVKGLGAKINSIVDAMEAQPGKCGYKDSDLKLARDSVEMSNKSSDKALLEYAKLPK